MHTDEHHVIEDEEQTTPPSGILPVVLRGIAVIAIAALMGGAVWYARNEAIKGSSATIHLSSIKGTQPQAAKPANGATPSLPPDGKILALLRATMLAIDHGMKTGNFTVVRDLGATSFRKSNSAAKLGQIFNSLSANQVDLLATAVVEPQFTKPPMLTPEKMLYLTGLFPIPPRAAAFEMLLELEDGEWRIYAIAIAPVVQQ